MGSDTYSLSNARHKLVSLQFLRDCHVNARELNVTFSLIDHGLQFDPLLFVCLQIDFILELFEHEANQLRGEEINSLANQLSKVSKCQNSFLTLARWTYV